MTLYGRTASNVMTAVTHTAPSSRDPESNRGGPWAWARPGAFWELLRTTAREWSEDKVPRLGAALAFYSVLSIAPLLLIAIAIAALVFGQDAARGSSSASSAASSAPRGRRPSRRCSRTPTSRGAAPPPTLIGFATLLFGASGVFGQLQDAMNTIWEVQPKPGRGILGVIRDRFLSFAMVLGPASCS